MRLRLGVVALAAAIAWFAPAQAQTQTDSSLVFQIRHESWTAADEKLYGEFVAGLGASDCGTVDACLKSTANPYRASDPADLRFRADCADLPYFLRAYFAWKRGLPFAYEASVSPRGRSRDIRYSPRGNVVDDRRDVLSGSITGPELLASLRDTISSAMYRTHPTADAGVLPDHYPVALKPGAIRPGTVIYDPNGHLIIVFKIEADGRIRYIDAHPDNSVSRGVFDKRFVRASPDMGAGFKNWRPITLVHAIRGADGIYRGGEIQSTPNRELADYSDEQFYGNGARPADADWREASFTLDGETLDYYDYVRARMAGGLLRFDPVNELRQMVRSNCADLAYRAEAVDTGIAAGLARQQHPERLPYNIYGTDGDWEIYSTPSRDARLKTAFVEVRDAVARFLTLQAAHDRKIVYAGTDLTRDLKAAYEQETAACSISYTKSDGRSVRLSYEDARGRLFRLSFDPYHCAELRWGAEGTELGSCPDGDNKRAWYASEQRLRNQIERTYESRMDFGLEGLRMPGPGKGVDKAPDTDVRALLAAGNFRQAGRIQ